MPHLYAFWKKFSQKIILDSNAVNPQLRYKKLNNQIKMYISIKKKMSTVAIWQIFHIKLHVLWITVHILEIQINVANNTKFSSELSIYIYMVKCTKSMTAAVFAIT